MIRTTMLIGKTNAMSHTQIWVTFTWGSLKHRPVLLYAGGAHEQGWFCFQEMCIT